jgi:hypothetical protein
MFRRVTVIHQTYIPWKHFNSHWLPYIPYAVTQKNSILCCFNGHKFQIANTNTPILRLTANTGNLYCQNQSATVKEIISVYCDRCREHCVYCTDSVWAEREVFDSWGRWQEQQLQCLKGIKFLPTNLGSLDLYFERRLGFCPFAFCWDDSHFRL